MANNPNAAANLKPFTKKDPRINRKGRPKNFDALRALAKQIANEKITSKNGEVIMSRIELIMRDWASSRNDKLVRAFVEYAYGKVSEELEVNAKGKIVVTIKHGD